MKVIIRGKKIGEGPLTTDQVKVFINGVEEKGIQKISFMGDASSGRVLTVVKMELIPDDVWIEGNFPIKEKKINGLIIQCDSNSTFIPKETVEHLFTGRTDIFASGRGITVTPRIVEVDKPDE